MNHNRPRHLPGRASRASALLLASAVAAALVLPCLPISTQTSARACLTANLDRRAVQWSTDIVQAKLTSLGDRVDLPINLGGPTSRPSGRPVARAYRVVTFSVTDAVDGSTKAGDEVKALVLIGGQPGDGICPALLPESVGKKFILLLRPLVQSRIDVANGTDLSVPRGAMVIVSQLGEADMNSETMNDLKAFVSKSRQEDAAVKSEQISVQADAVAAAQDQTEEEHAEKALSEMGPVALSALQDRLKSANAAGQTRLKRLIEDLSPPALSAEPE